MDMTNRLARLGFTAALLALLLGPLVFGAQAALAHPTEATYYGGGQEPGTTISASIDGETCDSFDTGDDGIWVLYVDEGDCNGNAVEGATVNFHIGDALAAESVVWAPADVQSLALTPAPEPEPEPTGGMDDGMDDTGGMDDGMDDTDGMDDGMDDTDGMDDGMDDTDSMDDGMDDTDAMDDTEGMTPGDKGDTGNAGFATGSGSSSMLLVLALGVLAAAGIAGARRVTGRID